MSEQQQLAAIRDRIDDIDRQLHDLLNARALAAQEVAQVKLSLKVTPSAEALVKVMGSVGQLMAITVGVSVGVRDGLAVSVLVGTAVLVLAVVGVGVLVGLGVAVAEGRISV